MPQHERWRRAREGSPGLEKPGDAMEGHGCHQSERERHTGPGTPLVGDSQHESVLEGPKRGLSLGGRGTLSPVSLGVCVSPYLDKG